MSKCFRQAPGISHVSGSFFHCDLIASHGVYGAFSIAIIFSPGLRCIALTKYGYRYCSRHSYIIILDIVTVLIKMTLALAL